MADHNRSAGSDLLVKLSERIGDAAATFEAVIKQHPRFELLDDAYFDLATSQYALAVAGDKRQYEQAANSYAALLDRSPRTKHREEALFYQGEALYALGKKAAAAKSYEQLLQEFKVITNNYAADQLEPQTP